MAFAHTFRRSKAPSIPTLLAVVRKRACEPRVCHVAQ